MTLQRSLKHLMAPSYPSTDPIFNSKNGFNPNVNPFYIGPEEVEKKFGVFSKKKLNFDDAEESYECESPKKLHKEEDDILFYLRNPLKRSMSESVCLEKQQRNDQRLLNIHKMLMQKKKCTIDYIELTQNLEIPDLASITSDMLNKLMNHENQTKKRRVVLIDTRFAFEYNAGHIKNSINICNPFDLETLFFENGHLLLMKDFYEEAERLEMVDSSHLKSIFQNLNDSLSQGHQENLFEEESPIIIIHCEFSQKRGPKLIRYLRKRDREINEMNYPNLIYPNVYLLKGGYSQFVKDAPEMCTNEGGYISMFNENYSSQCRQENMMYNNFWKEVQNIKIITKIY